MPAILVCNNARMGNTHMGTLYLLHIEPAYRHARHYLGFTTLDTEERITRHIKGHGSPLVKAALAAGCEITLAKTWPNADRNFERRLKNRGSSTRYCPLCADRWAAILQAQRERREALAV